MASSIHQLEEHGDEEGEDDDRHGSQITSPLLQPSSRCRRGRSLEEEEREAGDDDDDSPIEQMALTVPVGDDPETPVLTFWMWVLGMVSCAALSFLNAFFGYRKEPLTITAVSEQIAVLPVGRLMAAALPEGAFFRGRPCAFTLNPGPFNMKEHVLITIFANAGAGAVFGMNLMTSVRVFYGQHMSFFVALLILTSQAMAQVGVLVMLQPEVGGSQDNFFFAGIDKVRFRKPVIVGDTLIMRMTLTKYQKRFGLAKRTENFMLEQTEKWLEIYMIKYRGIEVSNKQ